jgi:DNA polymerase
MEELREILKFYQEIGASFLEVKMPAVKPPSLDLEKLHQQILNCTRCPLYRTKKNYVVGEGSRSPDIMFVGEGPGESEDEMGRPFVGRAGQLLDRIIHKMGYSRESVFIGNIVKCRPPANRDPQKEEVDACLPYLQRQIEMLKPKVLVCLGRVALNNLLGGDYAITRVRGQRFFYENIPVIPTFHPSYILHQRSREGISKAKWDVWNDMEKVLGILKQG